MYHESAGPALPEAMLNKWRRTSTRDWFEQTDPSVVDILNKHNVPFYEFIQYPGDVVYAPSGWWHQVTYIEDSIGATEQVMTVRNAGTVVDTLWHATLFGVEAHQPYDRDLGDDFARHIFRHVVSLCIGLRAVGRELFDATRCDQYLMSAPSLVQHT